MVKRNYSQIAYPGDHPTPYEQLSEADDRILRWIMRAAFWLSGLGLVIWATTNARFRDLEGFPKGTICLPIIVGISLILMGSMVHERFRRFAFWLCLVFIGQAVTLQIIDAGRAMRYQHFQPLHHPGLLAFLGVQTIIVTVAGWKRWLSVWTWLRSNLNRWQLPSIFCLFVLTGATVSENIHFYLLELPFVAFVQVLNLAVLLLALWSLPSEKIIRIKHELMRRFGDISSHHTSRKIDSFTVLAAVWVVVISAVISFFSYGNHPHISDEVSYVYQARYFAAGMLTMTAPPVSDAFVVNLMNYEVSRWYSVFPPGWPMALAVGVLLGTPWLINPLFAGLNTIAIATLTNELYDLRTSRIVVLLLSCSPWFIFMGSNFMSHTFTLTCALLAVLFLIRAGRSGKARWALFSGISIGIVSLIRPPDGFILALLLGFWAIGIGGRRLRPLSVAGLILGCALTSALILPYNKHLTGKFTELPVNAYFDKYYWKDSNAMGFGPERGVGWHIDPNPGHTPLDALINANLNTTSINYELFGWATGSLFIVILLIIAGGLRGNDWILLSSIAAVFIFYFFYYFSGGPDFGARYWYLMIFPLLLLTARGLQFLQARVGGEGRALVLLGVMILCLSTVINYFPWRAIDKYHHYLGLRPDVAKLAKENNFGRSLILVQGELRPDYASAAIYNPLDLTADEPVYAWDRSHEVRSKLLDAYSDRNVWVIAGPSVTGGAFKVLNGPIPAKDFLKANVRSYRPIDN